jgi:hypothetical protein
MNEDILNPSKKKQVLPEKQKKCTQLILYFTPDNYATQLTLTVVIYS